MSTIKDQVAFITGASRGIGKALALALARAGARVVVAAKTTRPHDKLPGTIHDTAREIGPRALPIRLDVRSEDEIKAAVAQTISKWGRIDILIHNAGAIHLGTVVDTPVKKFDLMTAVNARAAFILAHEVLPPMIARRSGHLLFMAPPVHPKAMPGKTAYLFTKFGMTMMAQSMAQEVRDHNVAINTLWPVTGIDSQATRHFWPGRLADWRTPDILCDAVLAIVSEPPSKRTGQALYDEDVLRDAGVTDFSRYACVPGSNPPPFSRDLVS